MQAEPIIADRAEFIDALSLLQRGRVLVRSADPEGHCVLDGGPLYTAHKPLMQYALVEEFSNPAGFPHMHYYRLSARGQAFARRACGAWRRTPLLQRLKVRLTG